MPWKIQNKMSRQSKSLFCPQCDVCMYTTEDVKSRDSRGLCSTCVEGEVNEFRNDVVRIVVDVDE